MDANQVIDSLGGTTTVARLCEVEPQAVSQWRENGIPRARLMYLKVVRPEAFNKVKRSTKVIDSNNKKQVLTRKVGSSDTPKGE